MSDENPESRHLSFGCIIGGKRCTRCCIAIHMEKSAGNNIVKHRKTRLTKGDWVIGKYWKQISKRIAKKLNPYMFHPGWRKDQKAFVSRSIFFKCTALVKGVCSVYEDRPFACRDFAGHGMYAYECSKEAYEKRQTVTVAVDLEVTKKAA